MNQKLRTAFTGPEKCYNDDKPSKVAAVLLGLYALIIVVGSIIQLNRMRRAWKLVPTGVWVHAAVVLTIEIAGSATMWTLWWQHYKRCNAVWGFGKVLLITLVINVILMLAIDQKVIAILNGLVQ